jgi:hypothetical protein
MCIVEQQQGPRRLTDKYPVTLLMSGGTGLGRVGTFSVLEVIYGTIIVRHLRSWAYQLSQLARVQHSAGEAATQASAYRMSSCIKFCREPRLV